MSFAALRDLARLASKCSSRAIREQHSLVAGSATRRRRASMLLDGNVTDLTSWGILATGHIASVFARDLALLPNEAQFSSRSATHT